MTSSQVLRLCSVVWEGRLIMMGEEGSGHELFHCIIQAFQWKNCGKVRVKVKLSLCFYHAMKTYWGRRGIVPLIFWPRHWMEVSGHLHFPAALPPAKEPLVPIGLGAEWAPEPVWTRWWREKFRASAGTRTPDHPARSPALYYWAIPAPGRTGGNYWTLDSSLPVFRRN
jgi:hypothetical protein